MKTLYIAIFSIAGVGLLIGGYFLYGYLTAKPEPTTTVDQPQQDQPIADQPAPVEATPAPEPEKPAPEPEKPAPTKETESLHVKGRDFVYKLHTHIDPNIKTLKEKEIMQKLNSRNS